MADKKIFNEYDMRTVFNPMEEDFTHDWDSQPHTIPANDIAHFPAFLAAHMAKALAWYLLFNKTDRLKDIKGADGKLVAHAVSKDSMMAIAASLLDRDMEADIEEILDEAKQLEKANEPVKANPVILSSDAPRFKRKAKTPKVKEEIKEDVPEDDTMKQIA